MARDWLGSGNVSARTFAERIIARALGSKLQTAIVNNPVIAPDVYPKILGLEISFDQLTAIPTVRFSGDSHTQSVSMLVSLSAIPSDAATRPGGTADTVVINAQSGSYDWPAFEPTPNATLYVAAWGYSAPGGVGLEAKQKATGQARYVAPALPQGTVSPHGNGYYDWYAQGPPGALSCKYAVNVGAGVGAPTIGAARAGTTITGTTPANEWSVIAAGPAAYGDKIVIRIIPYAGSGGTGAEFPSIVLFGAYQNTVATKYDTFPASDFGLTPAAVAGGGVVMDPTTGTLGFTGGIAGAAGSFALRVAYGLVLDSLYIYALVNGASPVNNYVIVGLQQVSQGTAVATPMTSVRTGLSAAVQLVTTGTGLSMGFNTNAYNYFATLYAEAFSGGPCTLYSVTIGYIQSTTSQGL